jgi:LuxR family transcriptional regulator, quorum-sensing system regulator SdiA
MATSLSKAARVAQILGKFRAIADTGFAMAVHIRYTRPTLLYQTYDQSWADHYSEKGYMLVDPTVHWGLSNTGSVDWEALVGQDSAGVIAAAQAHGLTNGWTYAVGAPTSRSLASMTRSKPFTAAERDEIRQGIDEIHALTEGFEQFPQDEQDSLRKLA